jgi:hypothetical protein
MLKSIMLVQCFMIDCVVGPSGCMWQTQVCEKITWMQVTYMWNGGAWLVGKESMWPWSKSPFMKGTSCKHKHGHYGHLSLMRGPKLSRLCLWLASPYPQRPTFAYSITMITSRPTTDISGRELRSIHAPSTWSTQIHGRGEPNTGTKNSLCELLCHWQPTWHVIHTEALGGMGDAKKYPREVQISSQK